MFGAGSSTSTNFSSSTHTTSRREDKLEEATPVLNETPIYTTSATSTTATSSNSRIYAQPPPKELANDPRIQALYEGHLAFADSLYKVKEQLQAALKNIKQLNENELNQELTPSEQNIDRRTQQASASVLKKPEIPQTIASITGGQLPLVAIAPVHQMPSLSVLNQIYSYQQAQLPPIRTLIRTLDLSAYTLNSSPLSAPTQADMQNLYQPLLVQAHVFEAQGQAAQAELIYQQMIQRGFFNAQVFESYARFLSREQRFAHAELYFQYALQMQPSVEIGIEYSKCLLQQNKKAQARQKIEQILANMQQTNPLYQVCYNIWVATNTN